MTKLCMKLKKLPVGVRNEVPCHNHAVGSSLFAKGTTAIECYTVVGQRVYQPAVKVMLVIANLFKLVKQHACGVWPASAMAATRVQCSLLVLPLDAI